MFFLLTHWKLITLSLQNKIKRNLIVYLRADPNILHHKRQTLQHCFFSALLHLTALNEQE